MKLIPIMPEYILLVQEHFLRQAYLLHRPIKRSSECGCRTAVAHSKPNQETLQLFLLILSVGNKKDKLVPNVMIAREGLFNWKRLRLYVDGGGDFSPRQHTKQKTQIRG